MQQSIRTMWVTLAVAGVVRVVMADRWLRCHAVPLRRRRAYSAGVFDHIPISKDPPGSRGR